MIPSKGVFSPKLNAFSSDINEVAGTPSDKKDEFAVACAPCDLTNAGFNLDALSIDESLLTPFSTIDPLHRTISSL